MARTRSVTVGAGLVLGFALIASGLVVSAPVGAAASMQSSGTLVVGAQHDTQAEFSTATLTNLTTTTTGDGAVTLDTAFEDGFEDEPADSGVPTGWETATNPPTTIEVVTTRAASGSQSLHLADGDVTGSDVRPADQPYATAKTAPVNVSIYAESGDHRLKLLEDGSTFAFVGMHNGDLAYYDDSWTTIATGVDNNEWVTIQVRPLPSSDSLEITWTAPGSSGQATVSLSTTITNGYTEARLSEANAGSGYYDDYRVGVGAPASAGYQSTHSVTGGEQAAINITQLSNATAELGMQYWDGSSWVGACLEAQQDGSCSEPLYAQNNTVSLPDVSTSKWRTQITVTVTGSNPQFVLADESILFNNHAPSASNLSPANGTQLTEEMVEFTVQVNDTEFPTAQGDEVTAALYVDGVQTGSKTVTSNGTVEISESITTGGDHTYHWELTDDYGATTTTATRTITVPNTLYIYNESVPHELISGTTTVQVTVTGSDGAVKRTTVSDGTVNMTGLPANQSYVFTVDAEGFYVREIYIESIYEQSSVFILNKSTPSVENQLSVKDRTGQFSENPIITVQRVINTTNVGQMPDNGDQWVTIGGDRLGASGFYVVNLQQDTRYRFVVRNPQGDTRVLGEYTAKASGEIPLEIGDVQYNLGPSGSAYEWDTSISNGTGGPAVTFAYDDAGNLTSNVSVTVKYRNNSQIVGQANFTSGPYGEVVFTQPISVDAYQNRSFVVEWSAGRDGAVIGGKRIVGATRNLTPPLPGMWMGAGYGAVVFLLAFIVGAGVSAAAGAITVSLFAAIAVFLGIAPPALGFGAVILGLFLSVVMLVNSQRGV